MKIESIISLSIPDIKVIKFRRFCDHRGYFTEHYRVSDFAAQEEPAFFNTGSFVQTNESYSKKRTIRGLHFQWNPYMGKLVRTVMGHMVDLALDIRKSSPSFGKIIAYDMLSTNAQEYGEWIWVPPGFAHGNYFVQDTIIEYYCTGQHSPDCEAGISPLANDIDWSLCEAKFRKQLDSIFSNNPLITDKDRNGYTVTDWANREEANQFVYKVNM